MKILFVCTGNTCRSPMAEGIFRHEMEQRGFENIMCQSAGLSALDGQHPSENAVLACKEIGVDISGHIARRFTPEEIKSIRRGTGLTQSAFAKYMGVSVKTVEAWEAGRNHPEGAACRLLAMTQSDPAFPQKAGIITAVRAQ